MIRQLSSLDATFLTLDDDRNYGHVGSIAILDPSTRQGGPLTIDQLREGLMERLHLIPPFTAKLATVPFDLDWPYWVPDEHFDITYHCRELALPKPGSMEQLQEQVARIYSRKLDRDRPLWELYLVHGLAKGRVALVSKVHHAAVDGMSGGEIMSMMYDVTPEGRDVDGPTDLEPITAPGGMQLLTKWVTGLPKTPVAVIERTARLLPHLDVVPSVLGVPGTEQISKALSRVRGVLGSEVDKSIIARPAIRPPKGAYDGEVSPHRIFGIGTLSLAEIKTVKNHFGVKVNDVVCTLVAGALREHMQTHGILPDRPLVAQVPVSVRTDDERGTFGNQVSVMFVPIATDLPDPEARLRAVAGELDAGKHRHAALPAKALRDVTQFIPPALHTRAARVATSVMQRTIKLPFNVIISNVPGPPIDIYTAGCRLEALYPLSIIADGALINVTVMSYRDALDVGITADREATPDVQSIVEGMQAELDRLLALTAG